MTEGLIGTGMIEPENKKFRSQITNIEKHSAIKKGESNRVQRKTTENSGHHYYSDGLQRKMKMLTASKAAIVEAPSGYGKTTAMRDYLEANAASDNICWFTAVDEEAPAMLYRRLCREIGKIDISVGERLLEIDFPNAFTIGEVCDALRSIKSNNRTWFVIDDFQFLFAILPPSFLYALLDNSREELCIVIITQMLGQDFQKSVARLGLPYITGSDLQWSAEDIHKYFKLAGENISISEANEVLRITDGWIIAVNLQLYSYRETGAFSDEAVLQQMEYLIWDKATPEQRDFFMRMSVFEACTLDRLCRMLDSDALPEYAASSIFIPFIRYLPEQRLCVPHTIFREIVCIKRREQGEEFEQQCYVKAGDVCREEGEIAEAVYFYAQIKDYRSILSLDLSSLVCAEIGDRTFNNIALEIARNCPIEIKREFPHSMLCVAWSVRFIDDEEFSLLMDELDSIISENDSLRKEWLLLSVYLNYPNLGEMLSVVKCAEKLFDGTVSTVILPIVPWAFYEYIQLETFHIRAGDADKEAALLEKFISVYSNLTGGHGSGADALFRAELAFFRCETGQAEIFAYKAVFLSESKQQKNIHVGAVRLLAVIAMLKSDLPGWQRAVSDVEKVAIGSMQNTSMFRAMLDLVHGSLLAQLREYDSIPEWLKNTGFLSMQLPAPILNKAAEIHAYYLMGTGNYAQLIGFLQTIKLEKLTSFSLHYYFFTIAVGYSSLGSIEQANKCIDLSAANSLPDGMLHCFIGFSRLLNALSDEYIEKRYPDFIIRFKDYKARYYAGWFALYRAIAKNELPGALTVREREIAELAADGLRNSEIAKELFVSEHTVRAHLRSIYQKLDIDRRAKLVKALN